MRIGNFEIGLIPLTVIVLAVVMIADIVRKISGCG